MSTRNKLSMRLSVSVTGGRSGAWKECLAGTGRKFGHVSGSLRRRRCVQTADSDPQRAENPPTVLTVSETRALELSQIDDDNIFKKWQ